MGGGGAPTDRVVAGVGGVGSLASGGREGSGGDLSPEEVMDQSNLLTRTVGLRSPLWAASTSAMKRARVSVWNALGSPSTIPSTNHATVPVREVSCATGSQPV